MLNAGDIGRRRPASDGNQNIFRRDGLAVHFDRVGIGENASAFVQVHIVVIKDAQIDAVQAAQLRAQDWRFRLRVGQVLDVPPRVA